MTWALTVPVGGNTKVVLLGLANHAHPDGSEAYPSFETLSAYAHCDRSTAKRNAVKLEEAGWIARDGRGPVGQVKWRLAMGPPFDDADRTGGQNAPGGGGAPEGGAPVHPEPSKEPSGKKERARDAEDSFPAELPPEKHAVAVAAGKILKATALKRGQQKKVTRAAVGQVVLSFLDRDHVQVARDVEFWLLHGRGATRRCADIVARYRAFLASSEPMAGPPLPAGVAPIRGKRDRKGDDGQDAEVLRNMRLELGGQP